MDIPALKAKYDIKELELNALLEITQAINNNLPEEALYKIYNFTLRANLNIKKLALYVLDDEWNCKVYFGTERDFRTVPFDMIFIESSRIEQVSELCSDSPFNEFDIVVPVAHKERKLAFVFVTSLFNLSDGPLNLNFIQVLSNIIIVAIENKKLARKQLEQEMIRLELSIAANVQQFLFPKELPYNRWLKVAAFYQPHHSIGGDYYDFVQINPDQFLFCIADVSGKGIPAALLMSNFQASLRTLIRQTTLLQEIITELNYQVMSNAEGQHFITFFVALYDRSRSRLKYVNAGHIPPVLLQPGHDQILLDQGTTVLGAFSKLPFLKVGIIERLERFTFCGFTDGLSEIRNAEDEELGPERVYEIVHNHAGAGPKELVGAITDAMVAFKGASNFKDDVTLLSCSVS